MTFTTLLLQTTVSGFFESFLEFMKQLGWAKGGLSFIVLLIHFWIFYMYRTNMRDKQRQIDALAADNREFRDRFLSIIDNQHGFTPKKKPKP